MTEQIDRERAAESTPRRREVTQSTSLPSGLGDFGLFSVDLAAVDTDEEELPEIVTAHAVELEHFWSLRNGTNVSKKILRTGLTPAGTFDPLLFYSRNQETLEANGRLAEQAVLEYDTTDCTTNNQLFSQIPVCYPGLVSTL